MPHKASQVLLKKCLAYYGYPRKICSRLATENRGLISRCSLQCKNMLTDPRLLPWGQESYEHFLVSTLRVLSKTSPLGCSCFKLLFSKILVIVMSILNGRTVQQKSFLQTQIEFQFFSKKNQNRNRNIALLGCDKFFTVKV